MRPHLYGCLGGGVAHVVQHQHRVLLWVGPTRASPRKPTSTENLYAAVRWSQCRLWKTLACAGLASMPATVPPRPGPPRPALDRPHTAHLGNHLAVQLHHHVLGHAAAVAQVVAQHIARDAHVRAPRQHCALIGICRLRGSSGVARACTCGGAGDGAAAPGSAGGAGGGAGGGGASGGLCHGGEQQQRVRVAILWGEREEQGGVGLEESKPERDQTRRGS